SGPEGPHYNNALKVRTTTMRASHIRSCFVALVIFASALVMARGQSTAQTRQIEVSETAGIRRTEYPVTARVELPRGALRDASNARLKLTEDVIAQLAAET